MRCEGMVEEDARGMSVDVGWRRSWERKGPKASGEGHGNSTFSQRSKGLHLHLYGLIFGSPVTWNCNGPLHTTQLRQLVCIYLTFRRQTEDGQKHFTVPQFLLSSETDKILASPLTRIIECHKTPTLTGTEVWGCTLPRWRVRPVVDHGLSPHVYLAHLRISP
jgi:hypothetical protein